MHGMQSIAVEIGRDAADAERSLDHAGSVGSSRQNESRVGSAMMKKLSCKVEDGGLNVRHDERHRTTFGSGLRGIT